MGKTMRLPWGLLDYLFVGGLVLVWAIFASVVVIAGLMGQNLAMAHGFGYGPLALTILTWLGATILCGGIAYVGWLFVGGG